MNDKIVLNMYELTNQLSAKAVDIMIYNDREVSVKYNGHIISEYVTDGNNFTLIDDGETTDLDRFMAVCGDFEGTEDDGITTLDCDDVIACFDELGRLRYIDRKRTAPGGNRNHYRWLISSLKEDGLRYTVKTNADDTFSVFYNDNNTEALFGMDANIIATINYEPDGSAHVFGSKLSPEEIRQLEFEKNRTNAAIIGAVEALDKEYDNAIAIFGGALHIDRDVASIALYLPSLLRNAELWHWHENEADTCRRFCHLCFVDPALVEAYLGNTFAKIFG